MRGAFNIVWLTILLSVGFALRADNVPSLPPPKPPQEFNQPTTLKELLALPPEHLEKCDIARMNLLCAEGLRGAENLDVQQCLETLDHWSQHVEDETLRNYHRFLEHPEAYNHSLGYYRMMMLATVLQEDYQAHYDPDRALPQLRGQHERNDVFFGDAGDVFINGILGDERRGTCSSLPVLYVAISRRLGYPVSLASTKEHLYVRYEEGTNHLNVDAAGEGFITHTDEEYRQWPHPLNAEEIKTYGYLQPMTQPEILGAFLTIRAANLTSIKKLDEAATNWEMASRYLPVTPVLQRIVASAEERAADAHNAVRWEELWDAVVTQPIPVEALDYFQSRQAEILSFMNRSAHIPAIERAAANLKSEVDAYVTAKTTDTHKVQFRVSFVPPPVRLLQTFEPDESLENEILPQIPRVVLPAERVPPQYWRSTPAGLMNRLQKLNNERDMIEEMNVYAVEEARLQNLSMQNAMSQAQFPPPPLPFSQNPETIRPEDLPLPWRGKPIPPELQNRLASLSQQNAPQSRIKQVIDDFFIEQDQQQMAIEAIQSRRSPLDQEPVTRPPFQLEIVPETVAPPLNLPLKIQPETPINQQTNKKGKL